MKYLFADLETFSPLNLPQVGSFRYAEDCEILLWGYAIDTEPARVWDCTNPQTKEMPEALAKALKEVQAGERKIVWHNGMMFDTVVLAAHGYHIPLEMIVDTMVIAYQHGLPGALGDLCDVLRMPTDKAKDKDGKRLVQLFCKPQPECYKVRRHDRYTKPEDWIKFINYCRLDVEAERELFKALPKWNCTEWEHRLQVLDAEINRRGMQIDVDLAEAAVELSERNKKLLAEETQRQTNGEVGAATQRDALIDYMAREYGWKIDTMTKAELEKRVDDPSVPEPVRELLKLRLMSTKTSIQKFKALLRRVNKDGRMRGGLQFRGASRTGRWSGRGFQGQNLARPTVSQDEIDFATKVLKQRDGTFECFYDDPSVILPNLLRGEIIAPSGKKLIVADYSNVEGRVLSWLAGEEWKLQAFRDFDAGHGHDLYKLAYARAFGVKPEDVTKPQRQIGKVLELALGYGGGAPAFARFAKAYGIDLSDMAEYVKSTAPRAVWLEAVDGYPYFVEKNRTGGLEREAFIACDVLKRLWRKTNPKIVQFWANVGQAVQKAIVSRESVRVGYVAFTRTESFLVIRLPSGRLLCYPSPKTNPSVGKDSFTYAGTNQFSRKWEKIESYGAKACIAAGTPVLCRNGWTPIEDVTPLDEVWDGVEWVSQFGPVNNGTRECIKAYGVWMTPDHKVLTVEGWKDAASQFDRAEVRLPNSCFRGRVASTEEAGMEVHMQCVRQCQDANNGRTSMERKTPVCHGLRVPPRPFAKFWIEDPRHVAIAALPYLLRDDKSVLRSFYEGLCAVRRSGHYCLRPVARVVRELLGGYGGRLRRQPNAGQEGQLRALLARKLPVGVCREASQQPTEHRFVPREADSRMGPRVGHIEKHHFESHSSRLPGTPSTAQGQIAKEVFDLTNCGPRHRFVVLGEEGPLIVHNCENITQAVACDLLSEGLLRMDAAGYKTVLTIHDEAITEAPDTDEFTFKKMEHLMSTLPDWAPELPLVAAGYEAYRYRKD
jgi:probable DNA polymerase